MSATKLLSDRYELGEMLGSGGMSEVRLGYDVRLGRQVAVKILRADLADDPNFRERFRREAHNAASLNHPAIVAVYDVGETDTDTGGLPYIVMEHVDGRTLREVIKSTGPMDPRRAMEVIADVCAALDFSHANGVVHRDVTPANVMITDGGAVKVMDFGIARAVHDGQSAITPAVSVLGTALYLSPEQARGQTVDARSDVYAAGCVLYELITGHPPFAGDSAVAISHRHVVDDPRPPSELNPVVSPALDSVVLTALTKGPDNRYQSAARMRADLVRVLAGKRPRAPKVMTEQARSQIITSPAAARPRVARRPRHAKRGQLRRRGRQARRARPALATLAGVGIVAALTLWWPPDLFDHGQPTLTLPNVVGQQVMAAEVTLRDAGFTKLERRLMPCWAQTLGRQPPCDEDQYGKVIATEPSEGTQVTVHTRIVLYAGQAPKRLPMPNLVNRTRPAAEKIVRDADLLLNPAIDVVANDDPAKAGTVASQDPRPRAVVLQGHEVRLSVYASPRMVTVTDYTGRSEEVARAGLEAAGFTVVIQWVHSARPRGEVLRQHPDHGRAVKGSEVVLDVSTGAHQPITMPDLIGQTEAEAREALQSAGHTGEIRTKQDAVADEDEDRKIIATTPDSGDTMRRNATVTLHIGAFRPADQNEPDDHGDDEQEDDELIPPTTSAPSPDPTRPGDDRS